ncbi:hypothetical protein ABE61_02000 [Lysinibacillus sphaericus]|nr:hypothetical protein [Lysinibacillus sphaericus]MBG9480097.1 hypothetical protein [Lysinibacillus sphaericus]MBG9593711.1 hypothetical protein [Lysinibacillus sphaericus]
MKAQRQQKGFICAKAKRCWSKALSQDVMLLAFVPLSLIPEESPSLHANPLIYIDVLTKPSTTFGDEPIFLHHIEESPPLIEYISPCLILQKRVVKSVFAIIL